MLGRRVNRGAIRRALTVVLAGQTGPASVRDLVTAVYHFTGYDHVGHGNVAPELRRLAAEGKARKTAAGMWVGVPS